MQAPTTQVLELPFGYTADEPMLFSNRLRILIRRLVGDVWGDDYSKAAELVTVTRTPRGYAATSHIVGLASIWTNCYENTSEASPQHAFELHLDAATHLQRYQFDHFSVPALAENWDGLSDVWIAQAKVASPVASTDYSTFDHFAQRTLVGGTRVRNHQNHPRVLLPRMVLGVSVSDL